VVLIEFGAAKSKLFSRARVAESVAAMRAAGADRAVTNALGPERRNHTALINGISGKEICCLQQHASDSA
jgi:hypothetical protein